MMKTLPFKDQYIPLILSGAKTQTRRDYNTWIEEGDVVEFGAKGYFLHVKDVRKERLLDISYADVLAEGFKTRSDFIEECSVPHAYNPIVLPDRNPTVFVLEFELLKRVEFNLSKAEAARELGVHRHTLANWVKTGMIKADWNGKIPLTEINRIKGGV
jgi:hypothetical protein